MGQSESLDYKVLLEYRAAKEQKEKGYDNYPSNFIVTVFEYNIFMTPPTAIGEKLSSRPLENGIEIIDYFPGFEEDSN